MGEFITVCEKPLAFKKIKAISGFQALYLIAQELRTGIHISKIHTPVFYMYMQGQSSCKSFSFRLQKARMSKSWKRDNIFDIVNSQDAL